MKLDKRITSIISHVQKCDVVADIGCDHGKMTVTIALNKLANKVVASDISANSVEKARLLVSKYNLDSVVDIRVGDGTSVLRDDECDTLIIAGMGGMLILDILASDRRKYNRYILSPQSDVYSVREYLSKNNLLPIFDYKVFSQGKFYDILVIEHGNYSPSIAELTYGYGTGEDFAKFYDYEKARLDFILQNADEDNKNKAKNKLDLLNSMLFFR